MSSTSCTFNRLLLKGLPYNVNKLDILNLLENYKHNISEIIINPGHAYVCFQSEKVLREAKEFVKGKYIGNRPIFSKLFFQRPEYQYRTIWRTETSRRHER